MPLSIESSTFSTRLETFCRCKMISCFRSVLPHTANVVDAKVKSVNFYHPIVNQEYIEFEDQQGSVELLMKNYLNWFLVLMVGIIAGVASWIRTIASEKLWIIHRVFLNHLISSPDQNSSLILYIYLILCGVLPTLLVSLCVVLIEPIAEGTGMESVIGYLNGAKVPHFGKMRPMLIIFFGSLLMSITLLPGGAAEPFIHVMTMLGVYITSIRIPFNVGRPIDEIISRRDLAAVGCGAGASAMFGTPIGGTLLALELLTYWSHNLTVKIFVSSLCASCINKVLFYYLGVTDVPEFDMVLFFRWINKETTVYNANNIPLFILLALMFLTIGFTWTYVQVYLNAARKRFIKSKLAKIIEAVLFAVMISVISYYTYLSNKYCFPMFQSKKMQTCDESNNTLNVLYLLLEDESDRINTALNIPEESLDVPLLLILWGMFSLSVVQLGIYVPTGIITPTIISGAVMARLFIKFLLKFMPSLDTLSHVTQITYLGAVAHCTGVTRLKFSLGVIVIESLGNPLFGFPVFVVILITNWILQFINYPIFQLLAKFKGIPVLDLDSKPIATNLTAGDIMSKEVKCLPLEIPSNTLYRIMLETNYTCYPIVSSNKKDIIITKQNVTTKILGNIYRKDIYKKLNSKNEFDSSVILSNPPKFDTLEPIISFQKCMNPSPIMIRKTASLARTYELFVILGLQHILVVDEFNNLVGIIARKDLSQVRYELTFCGGRVSRSKIVYQS